MRQSQSSRFDPEEWIATFIIDTEGQLWIADRNSEHVQCALGQDVLSAGEMTFGRERQKITVIEVTNQSTGYCPEPDSWESIQAALDRAGIDHPSEFTTAYSFRRCESCQTINLIKDDVYECAVCQSALPLAWNIDDPLL
ncbi:MAG: hypothetical protein KY468_05070 [Armatimonadetes bacterium]|nr:hypothetical protein [Armatimonadota bacterium]